MKPEERAKMLLRHYLSLLAERQGLQFADDEMSEVGEIVDSIVEAAKAEAAAMIEELKKEFRQNGCL
jgi:flagellar motility protein MotE (MotC chaperone)